MGKYWYFLLPAILAALIPSEKIDSAMRKRIPDDKKRAKCYFCFLIIMVLLYTVILFLVTANMPWHIRIPLFSFPLIGVALGFLIGKYRKK